MKSTRLLSFLNLVETTIQNEEPEVVAKQRTVNYHKGLACLTLSDGSSIHLQCFHLADGQICLKATILGRDGSPAGQHSIYPTEENYNWLTAAYHVMTVWKAGVPTASGAESDALGAVG
jgi:hypothetical protein